MTQRQWRRKRELELEAVYEMDPLSDRLYPDGRDSDHYDAISEWCVMNRCGRRTAYNQFRFRNEDEIAVFLLRWS